MVFIALLFFFLIFPPNCPRATLWSSITVRGAALLGDIFYPGQGIDFLCTLFYWTVFPPKGLQCWTKYSLLIMTQNKYIRCLANIHNFSFHLIFSSLHFHQYSPWLTVQSYQSNSEKRVGSLESPKANKHSKWSIIHKDSPIKILFFPQRLRSWMVNSSFQWEVVLDYDKEVIITW